MKTSTKQDRHGSSDTLAKPKEIRRHIENICAKNTRLEVTIDDHTVTFQSLFIEGSQDKNELLIDALIPHEGNELIKKSHSIKLVYVLDKIIYDIKSRYIDYTKDKPLLLRIEYPSCIERFQRREYFRIDPSFHEPIEFSFDVVIKIQGKMFDVSAGGFAFLTEKKPCYYIESGSEIKEVRFKLPGGKAIKTPARVKHISQHHDDKKYKCGVEFKAISEKDQSKIVAYTIQRQREILRKIKGD